MLSLVLSLIDLVLIFVVFGLFKNITDNQNEILLILRDEVNTLNRELQDMRDDGKWLSILLKIVELK